MKKLLLVVLAWMTLAGVSQADDAPAGIKEAEPGIVTRTANVVRRVSLRIKGVWLGSHVRKGMSLEQVCEIIDFDWRNNGGGLYFMPDPRLGITVRFKMTVNAARSAVWVDVDYIYIDW